MDKIRAAVVILCSVLFLVAALGGDPSDTRTASAVARTATESPVSPTPEPSFDLDALAMIEQGIASLRAHATVTVIEPVGSWYTAVPLHNANSGDDAEFRISERGIVHADDAAALKKFFRCRRSGKRRNLAPGVLAMLVDIARTFPGHTIDVVSGVRAKPYGVKGSKHFVGRAIDLRVQGVKLTTLRDHMWRNHAQIGVGYYPHEGFVHVDYRPEQDDTAWTAPRRSTRYRYNPTWSRRVRATAEREANAAAERERLDSERMANLRVW